MPRFIICCIIVALFLILSLPVLLVEWLIGKKWPRARDLSSFRIIQGVFRLLLFISGVHITQVGRENLPTDTSCMLAANHRSIFDILILISIMPRPTGIVAKKELDRFPVFNLWMRMIHCLFLDRNDLRQGMKTIQTATEYVEQGFSMLIFPEGTRCKEEDERALLPFHEGSFRIAVKSGHPMIPVALSHTQEIFERQFPRICPTQVTVGFLPAVDPAALSRQEQKKMGEASRSAIREFLGGN